MKSGSFSSYRAAGALGPQEPPDEVDMKTISEICPRCNGFVWHRQRPCNCKPVKESLPEITEFIRAVGERIVAARSAKSLSQEKLADRIGMSKTGLWQIEKGHSEPMARTIAMIATALDVTTDHLLFGARA